MIDTLFGLSFALFALSVVLSVALVTVLHRERRELAERRRAEHELRDRETKLSVLIDNLPALLWTTDRDLRFTSSEGAGLASLGLRPGQVVGLTLYEYFGVDDPEFLPIRSHRRALGGESTAYEYSHKDLTFQTFVEPLRDGDGRVSGTLGLAVEVTDSKSAREALRESERQLFQAQKMEALGSLAGGIAHDFNNILTPILGYSHMVLEVTEDEQARHDVEQVIKAGKRARDLVRQILAFGRYSEGTRAVQDLRSTVKEAVKLLRASIPTTVDIQVEYSERPLPVAADPTHIHQIVLNLGTNAYHAMKAEGGILHIEVDTAEVAEEVADRNPGVRPGVFARIVVSDTGEGMRPEVLARIYEPFFTTKEVGKGTGLGLSVVHGIVTALNGFIQTHSAIGEGSRFEIYFPLSEAAAGEEESADIDVVGGEEHILVVDDDPDIAEMLRRLLGSVGYRVKAETDSRRALERVRSGEEVDLVLTDQTMPNLTGVEMARRLRHIRPGLPILLITGYGDTLDPGELRDSGIARMLMKPVVPGRLEQAIREVLREARFRGGTHGEDPGHRG